MAGPTTYNNTVNRLDWKVPIVNTDGTPTNEFMRKWQQQAAANATIPNLTTAAGVSAVIDLLSSTIGALLVRGTTQWAGLVPVADGRVLRDKGVGNLPIWDTISDILDTLGSTQGDVLYRDASAWKVLAPGTNGQVLTSGGAAANPSWTSPSSGGSASSFFLDGTHGYVGEVDSNGLLVLDSQGRGVYSVDPVLPVAMIPALPAAPYPTGFRFGGKTSNNVGTPNTKIDIAAFTGRDSTDTFNIKSNGVLTIDATTTGANGLDTGSLANTSYYFIFVIAKPDGTTASLASLSASAPTMPGGYSYFRRVGAVRTDGSAHFLSYVQVGNEFKYSTCINDYSLANQGTSAVILTVSVPPIVVIPVFTVVWQVSNSLSFLMTAISDPDVPPNTISGSYNATGGVVGATGAAAFIVNFIPTNTSRQLRMRSNQWSAAETLQLMTAGWLDPFAD